MKVRNSKGQFVKAENTFKGLEIEPDKPIKKVGVVQTVVAMIIVFAILVLLDKCNVIQIVESQGH